MKRRQIIFIILSLVCISIAAADRKETKIKVACVGNSITYGFKLENRERDAYPFQLQRLLGENYEVENFGKSGATLINQAYRPYTKQEEYKKAIAFAGDIVVIMLGVNDTDPRSWPNYRDDFVPDYLSLINDFRKANPKCKIWICRLTPVSHRHPRFKSGTRDWFWQIQADIERVAKIANVKLIDLYSPLSCRPDLLPDALHPNAEGAGIIAQTVNSYITGNFGGLSMPITFTDEMVLQRNDTLNISGIANAGEIVSVSIEKQKLSTTAGDNGKWSVKLNPLNSATGLKLIVSTPSRKIIYKNVAVGEVWLCSGQSNMEFQTNRLADSERTAMLNYAKSKPQIRFFDMKARWQTDNSQWSASALDSVNRLQYYADTKWQQCDENNAAAFSAVGFAFGRMLADSLKVPIGLICNAVGGSGAEAWVDRKTLEFEFPDILYDYTQNDFIQDWVRGRALTNTKKSTNPLQRHPYEPAYLYEAGINPLQNYPIKGIVWYQGESNANCIETYSKLFSLMLNSWRTNWRKELPFYFVQLSSLDRPSWTWFRDCQRRLAEKTPNCGMAVSSDLGDSLDVHYRNKIKVGERLARLALNHDYGCDITPMGPSNPKAKFHDGEAEISFSYADGLKSADGKELRTFELAGEDGLFYTAEATVNGNEVVVRSEKVKNPCMVRYGWQPFTHANLVNKDNIPASTFLIPNYE
jgi:sialate O-acetylesterase